ncbi:L domain-like protein [Pluteus cervinus]|uniref:L domain-like protein n=1 Tax=Pluteus cervinus TaxID=181527 RepID=A0ACD3B4A4_9AGAR|nr:L domain-like protein [Pluteus cervinus]
MEAPQTRTDLGQDKSTLSARVVLPQGVLPHDARASKSPEKSNRRDDDSDEDEDEDISHSPPPQEGDAPPDGDFLVDFADETEELDLIHSRIDSIATLHLPRFAPYLKKLCLRQNDISFLDPEVFEVLVNLEELDLYDNKVKHVGRALDKLDKLLVLDLSFNLLKSVPEGLDNLQALHTIYFVQNKISAISGLHASTTLRSLELGSNRLRKIEGLDALVNLEELWLGKNKLTKIENLGHLKSLKILAIQSNRIVKLEGLEELENLEQLYLSHNGIKRLEGLEKNVKLTTLDVSSNFVPALENISHLTNLEELWMSGNQIPNLLALDTELRSISTLRTIYLEANPCQTSDRTGYRRKVILALPQVTQIDATYVRVP